MQLTVQQFEQIADLLPRQRGNVRLNNLQVLNASTKVHPVAADARNVLAWSLTAGQAGDAPQGRQLIETLGPHHRAGVALLVDGAYQDDATVSWPSMLD